MNVTPEQVGTVVQGASPVQIIILIFLGVIALGVIIAVVKWVVDLKTGTLPQEIKEIKKSLDEMRLMFTQVESKLWTRDDMEREIKSAIDRHMVNCPYRKQ